MSRLRITKIIETWDMRKRHALRRKPAALNLKGGEVLLAFNARQSIARFIDCQGGVHDYYADKREMFDVTQLTQMVRAGLAVELVIGTSEREKAQQLELVG